MDDPLAERAPPSPEQLRQFHALYAFYTSTIRNAAGLRGFALQLRVEKAATLEELLALRAPYLDLVRRARGNERASALAQQLEAVLGEA